MKQSWRWFGPHDTVSTNDMSQAGVDGVVTALHHLDTGSIWSMAEIKKRQAEISHFHNGTPSRLTWDVVESLPVSEDIKRQSGAWREHVENYKQSVRNLADCGINIICYNFMPILDWTRTDLAYELANGATCMRFDVVDFALFDVHILKRSGANEDYPQAVIEEARIRSSRMNEEQSQKLVSTILCGLPGAEAGYTLEDIKQQLDLYKNVSDATLRKHQMDFLAEIVPVAEAVGSRLCCHPDDPPFPLLGLPRIMSTENDYRLLVQSIDSPANGITLCSGSLGVRADNDIPGIVKRLGTKIHFVHLRNVLRETDDVKNSFYEAAHLEGSSDLVAIIDAMLNEENQRKLAGRPDCSIPFRPDHGQDILSDLKTSGQPGYPAVGRLKGLAELRGIIAAFSHSQTAAR